MRHNLVRVVKRDAGPRPCRHPHVPASRLA